MVKQRERLRARHEPTEHTERNGGLNTSDALDTHALDTPPPFSRHFEDGIWKEAFEYYQIDCGAPLYSAPEWVKEEYKKRARESFRSFLAKFED